jgi:predicted nucleic acid-binding protein
MKYIFDTSFLLSLVLTDDTNHAEAVEIFETMKDNSVFFINELTYVELLTVATYKAGVIEKDIVKSILNDLGTTFLNSGNTEYINFFEFLDKKISVTDASILYDARRYSLTILTFDREMIKIAGKIG